MLHQRYKDIAFAAISAASIPNYLFRKVWYSAVPRTGPLHLHLGSGPKYLQDFLNIDGNPFYKTDLWLDLRRGLPFPSNCADSVYSTHVFEHFYPDELQTLLGECFRVLKPGGGIRLIVPNLGSAIVAYSQNRSAWFPEDFPRHFGSLGGRFSNFVFCDGQHRTAFDLGYMKEILQEAGLFRGKIDRHFSVDLIKADSVSVVADAMVPPELVEGWAAVHSRFCLESGCEILLEKENRRGTKLSHVRLSNQRQRREADFVSEKEQAAVVADGRSDHASACGHQRTD